MTATAAAPAVVRLAHPWLVDVMAEAAAQGRRLVVHLVDGSQFAGQVLRWSVMACVLRVEGGLASLPTEQIAAVEMEGK